MVIFLGCDIYECLDVDVCIKEGFELIKGLFWGKELIKFVIIEENGFKFEVDIFEGYKIGFYLD